MPETEMPLLRRALTAAAALAVLASTTLAASAFTDEEKKDIGAVVRQYLLDHPEIIEETMVELRKRREAEELAARSKALEENKELIFTSKRQVVLGNPEGDVTLVEFFDYNCGYCKRALPDMEELLKTDPKLRIVLKEFPILTEGSVEAAKVAVAVNMQAPEKYRAFHNALFATRGEVNGKRARDVAEELGIDLARLDTDLKNPEILATLQEGRALSEALNINGTPSYIVGNELIPGAVGIDALREKIAAVRACGKTSC